MKVEKAYAISDAKIAFVLLVDKAANKRELLITKAENGVASIRQRGKAIGQFICLLKSSAKWWYSRVWRPLHMR